jgi:hypothetical protein
LRGTIRTQTLDALDGERENSKNICFRHNREWAKMGDIDRLQAASYGLSVNQNGGVYHNGSSYDVEKIRIENTYVKLLGELPQGRFRPNLLEVARQCQVDEKTLRKIEGELIQHGRVQAPILPQNQDHTVGAGAHSLTDRDRCP